MSVNYLTIEQSKWYYGSILTKKQIDACEIKRWLEKVQIH
jgi:hypothetical protein